MVDIDLGLAASSCSPDVEQPFEWFSCETHIARQSVGGLGPGFSHSSTGSLGTAILLLFQHRSTGGPVFGHFVRKGQGHGAGRVRLRQSALRADSA